MGHTTVVRFKLLIPSPKQTMSSAPPKSKVAKSYYAGNDPILDYCNENTHIHPVQKALLEETLNVPRYQMLGAPEVLAMNMTLIKTRRAKKVLDIGTFTGASALASALAFGKDIPDGQVITCDVEDTHLELAKKHWKMAGVEDRIQFKLGPASETLQSLIDDGQAGTFDFVFIDADKTGYDQYYEQCLILLGPGGVVAFDNTLWYEKVLKPAAEDDHATIALQKLNKKLAADTERAFVVQVNIGDGYTLATKL